MSKNIDHKRSSVTGNDKKDTKRKILRLEKYLETHVKDENSPSELLKLLEQFEKQTEMFEEQTPVHDPQQVIKEEKSEITQPEKNTEIEPERSSVMERYTGALKNTPSSTVIFEQDLQNTTASMADLKNIEKSIRNIQTSLTSLGGGGLGEKDVLELVAKNSNSPEYDSADLNVIDAGSGGDDF